MSEGDDELMDPTAEIEAALQEDVKKGWSMIRLEIAHYRKGRWILRRPQAEKAGSRPTAPEQKQGIPLELYHLSGYFWCLVRWLSGIQPVPDPKANEHLRAWAKARGAPDPALYPGPWSQVALNHAKRMTAELGYDPHGFDKALRRATQEHAAAGGPAVVPLRELLAPDIDRMLEEEEGTA